MSEPAESNGWTPPDPGLPPSGIGRPHSPWQPEDAAQAADQAADQPRPLNPAWPSGDGWSPGPGDPYAPRQPSGWPQQYGATEQGYGVAAGHAPGTPYWEGAPAYPQGWAPGLYGAGPPVKRARTVEPPKGRPFHQVARNEAHRWWRPLVGSLAIVVIGVGLAVLVMLVGTIVRAVVTGDAPDTGTDVDSVFGNKTADLAFDLGSLALFLPVALGVAWLVQRRGPGTLSSVEGRLRWRWLLVCSGLAVLFCVVSYGTSVVAALALDEQPSGDEHWVGWGRFLAPAIVIILLVPFQAAAEEYVFRGWLLQAVGACTLENARGRAGRAFSAVFRTPWPGIVVGSALFTAGHGYTSWGILDIFLFGAIAAWLAVRTGGLESGIALHVFNNLMAFLLPAAVGELDMEQGSVPWQAVVADVIPMLLYALAVGWLARRMRLRNVTAGHDAPAEAPGPVPVS